MCILYMYVAQSIAIMNRFNDFRKTHLTFDYYFKYSLTQKNYIYNVLEWKRNEYYGNSYNIIFMSQG